MTALLLAAAVYCGVERADVKQLADPAARTVAPAQACTIDELVALPAPKWQDHAGRALEEMRMCTVSGVVFAVKPEADSDIHIAIRAASGATMVIELVHPDCIGKGHVKETADARRALLRLLPGRRLSKRMMKLEPGIQVTVTGPVFFDKVHGQTGVAPSGVEIHPVLRLKAGK